MKLSKVLLGVFSVAIASGAIAAEPAPVIDISNSKFAGSQSTSERLNELERKLEARNRAQVNVQRQLDELQNEVNELRGVTELHTHQLSQVLERQRELYQELDRRVSQALKPANSVPASIEAPANSVQANYSSNLTENEAYDKAVNLILKDRLYDQAIPEFQAFLQNYPDSSYVPNAHYWLGQLLFNKQDWEGAGGQFQSLISNYPESSKRADATLKLGVTEMERSNTARAKQLWEQVIRDFPNSSSAKLAQKRLKEL